jgi:hydrogenase expression/formation protein HypC
MCIVAPGRVIAHSGFDVLVDHEGRRRRASTLLVGHLEIGDWVLVGSGTVLRRLDADEALELLATIRAAEAQLAEADALPMPEGGQL